MKFKDSFRGTSLSVVDLTVTGDLTVNGSFNFGNASVDIFTIAGYIQGSASGKTFVSVGNVTTAHSLAATNDLAIAGKLEVQGVSWLDGLATLTKSSLGTTTSAMLSLVTDTAATVGAQQVSPAIMWTARGWETTGGTSQTVGWQMYVLPVQGASNSPSLIFQAKASTAGAYVDRLTISGAGSATFTGTVSANNKFTAASVAVVILEGRIADGASAIAIKFQCASALSTAGAKIASFYNDNGTTEKAYIDLYGGYITLGGSIQSRQGTDIASATNIVIPSDGDVFELTGTTKVDLIASTGRQNGATVVLVANESVVIDHGTATSGSNITILLNGAGDFSMTANDTLTLCLCETTAGGQAWREVARSVI